jgi:hypothetical protein
MRILMLTGLVSYLALGGCERFQTKAAATPPVSIGRYVIVHSPQTERDVILLDTASGRTWALTEETYLNGNPYAWEPVTQLNSDADRTALETLLGPKPKGAATRDNNSN